MKKIILITTTLLVFSVMATQTFAGTIIYENVNFSWGDTNVVWMTNNNQKAVYVSFVVEFDNGRITEVKKYPIAAGESKYWPGAHSIKELRNIIVNFR